MLLLIMADRIVLVYAPICVTKTIVGVIDISKTTIIVTAAAAVIKEAVVFAAANIFVTC